MFEKMTSFISDKIKGIEFTKKLKNHPVCLKSAGEISLEMEKVLKEMPNNQGVKAEVILEINENHEISKKLKELYKNNNIEELETYTKILYGTASLIEGIEIDNPTEISNLICKIISK